MKKTCMYKRLHFFLCSIISALVCVYVCVHIRNLHIYINSNKRVL